MPVGLSPWASRDSVHVVLRARTSTSPVCNAAKRLAAVSGTNFTLFASLKIAAATARQKSTSKPVQLPWASGRPKPGSWPLEPQLRTPRCLTVSRVAATAVSATTNATAATNSACAVCFIVKLPDLTLTPVDPEPPLAWSPAGGEGVKEAVVGERRRQYNTPHWAFHARMLPHLQMYDPA